MTDTADQRELRRSVRALLEAHAPVRAQLSDDGAVWERLTGELGLTGLAVREEHGGAGGSVADLAVVLEEAGRTLLRPPLLATAVAATVLQDRAPDLLPGLLDGSVTAALALSGTGQVADAPGAGLLLVAADGALGVVEQPRVDALEPLDPTRPLGHVHVDDVRVVGDAGALAAAQDLLHVALAAEAVGGAQRCLELTVAHLKDREQFGRPLGSFQALRHPVADLTVLVEGARSSAWYAARSAADRSVAAPLAAATAMDAYCAVAGETIQLHGGIGFTWEHDAHLYFKRAWTTALLHGGSRALRRTAFDRAHEEEAGRA